MKPDPDRVRELFIAALRNAGSEGWNSYLEAECGGDGELARMVRDLLDSHLEEDGIMRTEAVAVADFPISESAAIEPVASSEGVGTNIGPYKLLQEIGQGGMGVVYMAEQSQPVRRQVALKLIRPGMDSRHVLARFDAERQALALMDHPNIARVLDAGATDSRRPYFVMELIKGVPITQYCDEHRLTPRGRLELFLCVCQAVQHAHQKGIIHRDLKPSNVLIGLYDGRPVPKIIDFGVAKAAGPSLTEATLFTGFGTVVGTPEYMSPEQAQLDNIDIDTRTDIYSLGVLLYELLTGSTPFTRKDLEKAGLLEMLRVIREQEPIRPSVRLSTVEGLPSLASKRGTEPARLTRQMRGDLDWIVMKCLEKDRDRRYETANGLARELERYLCDEPVTAGPPSATYRFRKFARRNWAAFLTVVLLAMTLVVGAAVSMWQAQRAWRAESLAESRLESERMAHARADFARSEAVAKSELARGNLRKARQAVDDMYTGVAERWLAYQPHMESVQREFLEKALSFYQVFAQQDGGTEPEVRLETATAYRRVADIQFRLGASEQAETAFREAIGRLRALADESTATPECRAILADSLHRFGILLGDIGLTRDEEKTHREALALQEKLAAELPAEDRFLRDVARGQYHLGSSLVLLNRQREAAEALDAAIVLQEKLAESPSPFPEDREYLADSLRCRGLVRVMTAVAPEPGLTDLRRSICLFRRLVDDFPDRPQYRNELAETYFKMAQGKQGHLLPPIEAEQVIKQALVIQRKLAVDFPRVMYYRYDLLRSLQALARRMKASRRTSEATDVLREALPISEKLAAETSPSIGYVHGQAGVVAADLAKLLADAGHANEADDLRRRLIESPKTPEILNIIAWFMVNIADVEHDAALAVKLAQKAADSEPRLAHFQNTLGVAHFRAGDWRAAIAALNRSDELAPDRFVGYNAFFRAMALWRLGETEGARNEYGRAVIWMDRKSPHNAELIRFRAEAEALLGVKAKQ